MPEPVIEWKCPHESCGKFYSVRPLNGACADPAHPGVTMNCEEVSFPHGRMTGTRLRTVEKMVSQFALGYGVGSAVEMTRLTVEILNEMKAAYWDLEVSRKLAALKGELVAELEAKLLNAEVSALRESVKEGPR